MRISGGELRGKQISCPPGVIRPAMDRMRESLFSILGSIDNRSFLDLFSGSGLVGIEAWSRGARPVVLVEKDRGKRKSILSNIAGLAPQPVLRIEPVERYVQRNRTPFEIVYLDPPFDYPYKEDILRRLCGSRTLSDRTIVIIHAPKTEPLPETVGPVVSPRIDPHHHDGEQQATSPSAKKRLIRYDQRDYGGSRLTFYRFENPGAELPSDDRSPGT